MSRPPAPAAREETADAARASFPSRVAPVLVLEFLDLPCLASALRVSVSFSESAEPVFHEIARRYGRTDKAESSTWREFVRLECNALIWIGAIPDETNVTVDERIESARILPKYGTIAGLGSSRVTNSTYEDVSIVARGLPLNQVTEWRWRVKMSKRESIVDSYGLAFYSTETRLVELAILWHSDGARYYNGIDWMIEPPYQAVLSDFEDYTTCTLEIYFRKTQPTGLTLESYVVELYIIYEGEAPLTMARFTYPQEGEIRNGWRGSGIHIAPLAMICENSTATLERAPLR